MKPERSLYAAVLETSGYTVGDANEPSGIHVLASDGEWTHMGWTNVRAFGLEIDPRSTSTVLLAAGNGLLRSLDGGGTWRVETDWQVTEVLDVAIDMRSEATWLASAHGMFHSSNFRDWTAANEGLPSRFCQRVVADERDRLVVAGTEEGLATRARDEQSWQPVGPRYPIRDLVQSSTTPSLWLAGTEDHGVLVSDDGAKNWSRRQGIVHNRTIYAVAIHADEPTLMVAAGYEKGLVVSDDGGRSWCEHRIELDDTVHALVFEAGTRRAWLGTSMSGVYNYDLESGDLVHSGLPDSQIRRLLFQPEKRAHA